MEETQPIEAVPEQPAAPITENKKDSIAVPTSIIRWFFYIVFFYVILLTPFLLREIGTGLFVSLPLILAQFAGQLNKLIDK